MRTNITPRKVRMLEFVLLLTISVALAESDMNEAMEGLVKVMEMEKGVRGEWFVKLLCPHVLP